jgi:hypothetical protein
MAWLLLVPFKETGRRENVLHKGRNVTLVGGDELEWDGGSTHL